MSGGIDSFATALLLRQKGYEVIGVNLVLWEENDLAEMEEICRKLSIPLFRRDGRELFRKVVVKSFVDGYLSGYTPSPCCVCNSWIKWKLLLASASELGAFSIATGHYARVEVLPNGRYAIRNSVTASKDQTYALYNLTQNQLAHTLMPVGDYTKEEIRKIAQEHYLPVAHKADSQDICFVPDGDYGAFLQREAPDRMPGPGNFVTEDGEILGTHKGITHYTVGQRKGLGIAMGHPVYVSEIRPETNEVVIALEDVYSSFLTCNQLNFMGMEDLKEPRRAFAKVRYSHKGEWCTIEQTGEDEILCTFEKPVRAIAPGQACVFYDGEYVLGGGTICNYS